jgi:ribonuclease R
VHRALIRALKLGDGGPGRNETAQYAETAEQITATERRAQAAERDAVDRYLAAFMADRIGEVFAARVSGVTRFGLFITVSENGANGIVPRSALPDDLWRHDEREQTLTGRHTGLIYRLAQEVEVRLAEANPVTGGLVFRLMHGVPVRPAGRAGRLGKRSRFR